MSSTPSPVESFITRAGHLCALTVLGISGPLLNILGEGPAFFVNHRASPLEVITVVLLLVGAIPALLLVIEGVVGIVSRRAARPLHYAFVAILAFAAALPLTAFGAGLPGTTAVAAAAVLGIILAVAGYRTAIGRRVLLIITPLLVIAPATFFLRRGVRALLLPAHSLSEAGAARVDSTTPVVMVVFDEFSLNVLLDENLDIDGVRFPNFAALRRASYWFRNTTTVNQFTPLAVPAILSGKFPHSEQLLPTADSYPVNIFTLLGRTHQVQAYEPFTKLCPGDICREKENTAAPINRVGVMMADLAAVYLNYAIPADLGVPIPDIGGKWGYFWSDEREGWNEPKFSRGARVSQLRSFIGSLKPSARPVFFFAHVILPHMPYHFMPSGKMYEGGVVSGYLKERWADNEVLIQRGYQQYLLQVGATDRLVGRLLSRLKELGLYERSLLVIAADHGVSFSPHTYRRGHYKHSTFYEDVMSVPLFIKLPHQKEPVVSDRNVETIDILPSILDVLKITSPSALDGSSVFDTSTPPRPRKRLLVGHIPERRGKKLRWEEEPGDRGRVVEFPVPDSLPRATLDWKLALPGYRSPNRQNVHFIGPYSELIGTDSATLPKGERLPGHYRLIERRQGGPLSPSAVRMDPKSPSCPCHIQGLVNDSSLQDRSVVTLAVNGVLQGFVRLARSEAGELSFAFFVPETAFRAGLNELALYGIEHGEEGGVLLRPLEGKSSR